MQPRDKKQNDTVAVALSYDETEDSAPKLTAKGKGEIAIRILALAEQHGIDVVQDENLAELLHKLDLDELIPIEAYIAVAEIFSYIHKKSKKMGES